MAYCSPKNRNQKDTCLDGELIDNLVRLYNQSNAGKSQPIDPKQNTRQKINALLHNLRDEISCDKEYCLIDSDTLKPFRDQLKQHFRPILPKEWLSNPRKWLNTNDISAVLRQYNAAHKDFYFIAVSPIDFDAKIQSYFTDGPECVQNDLCALNISQHIAHGKKRFAAVFNLDKHNESGSHWTSMFIDLYLGEGYYFDSVANYLPPEIVALMSRITTQTNRAILEGKLHIKKINQRFNTKDYKSLDGNKIHIPISQIIQFLVKDDNFRLYRFGTLILPKIKSNLRIDMSKYERDVLGKVLDLIERTKNEEYARFSDDDIDIDSHQFPQQWARQQISKAVEYFLSGLDVIGNENMTCRVVSKGISADGLNVILQLDKPIKGTIYDLSFHTFKNYIQHQFKNTECGVYSIHFVDDLVNGRTFREKINHPESDDRINKLRYSKYFTPLK